MTKVCLIGNSHIAALKLGWDALKKAGTAPDLEPTFFGAPQDGIRHLRAEGGCLVPKRKDITESFQRMAGLDRIRLDDYDAFFLIGLNISVKRILRFYKTHAWMGLQGRDGKVTIHPGFARAYLTERYGDTLMLQTAGFLKGRKVLAMAEPFWAEFIRKESGDMPEFGWDQAISNGDAPAIAAMFAQVVPAALSGHAQFLPQPPDTVAHGIMTRDAYNKGASKMISGEGGGSDAAHMNGDFGQTYWPLILPALAAM